METKWESLVSGEQLNKAFTLRKSDDIKIKVPNSEIDAFVRQGYSITKPGSRKTELKKKKPFSEIFENEVWLDFYNMGFETMNSDNHFSVCFPGDRKQIDVVAIDAETIIVVECKATESLDKTINFKKEVESINGYWPAVRKELLKKYPNRKTKYVFATKNYKIIDPDLERAKEFGIFHFNYDTVLYYRDLAEHLGKAAKYQLLGNLFQKQEIKGLENKVPAIRGFMGGLEYYSFLIEPERLLKLAYVLHRNNANISNFPTYQRLIKKDRLKHIRAFINEGGFFPNSMGTVVIQLSI